MDSQHAPSDFMSPLGAEFRVKVVETRDWTAADLEKLLGQVLCAHKTMEHAWNAHKHMVRPCSSSMLWLV